MVDAALDQRAVVLEHRPAHLERLGQTLGVVGAVGVAVEAQHRPAVGDDVHTGHDLGQHRRRPTLGPIGRHPEVEPRRPATQSPEQRVGLVGHGGRGHGDGLLHPQRTGAGRLGRQRGGGGPIERAVDGPGAVRGAEHETHAAQPPRGVGAHGAHSSGTRRPTRGAPAGPWSGH